VTEPKEPPPDQQAKTDYPGPRLDRGGIQIQGSIVGRVGGDIVGRDQIKIGEEFLDEIFNPIAIVIEDMAPGEKLVATELFVATKTEVEKGRSASDSILAMHVEKLVDTFPRVADAVTIAFGHPMLGTLVGPVTRYVVDRIAQRKTGEAPF
jgi:hypothetical protein